MQKKYTLCDSVKTHIVIWGIIPRITTSEAISPNKKGPEHIVRALFVIKKYVLLCLCLFSGRSLGNRSLSLGTRPA